MNQKRLITLLAITFFLIGVTGILLFLPNQEKKNVNNFEECALAGNPVMESYPRQCRTPDGKLFVEELVTPIPEQIPEIDFVPLEYSTPSADFRIEEQRTVVIHSQQEWYDTFGDTVEPPLVDFEQKTLLGVFAGMKESGGYFVTFNAVRDAGQRLSAEVSIQGPGEGCAATQALTYPYQLVTVPSTDREVSYEIVEEIIDCEEMPAGSVE